MKTSVLRAVADVGAAHALPAARPARVPPAVFAACGYFLPRLMFLQSRYAPQIHWGDIAIALRDFPEENLDLASSGFWQQWRSRWVAQAESYLALAGASCTASGQARAQRSAAACYHWAEFMDFDSSEQKLALRRQVRQCFERSVQGGDLLLQRGAVVVDGVNVPYSLLLPPAHVRGNAPLPCMIFSNGLDSMTEIEVLAMAEPYLERGMAALLFDGPGQGIHVGQMPLQIAMEKVVAVLVEMLHGERAVDCSRLGFFGISFGGYFALRMAQKMGTSFRCIVNFSGGPQVASFQHLPRRLKDDFCFVLKGGAGHSMEDMQDRLDALALDLQHPCATQVLSVHGALDDIFPISALRALDQAWGERHTLWVHEREAHVCLNLINSASVQAADWAARQLGLI